MTATPTTPPFDQFAINEQDEATPPTPAILPSKFSQSVSNARAPSPALRPKSRPSLPRPESPLRRVKVAPATTPGGSRPSLNLSSQNRFPGPRYAASPTPTKLLGTGSVRGPAKARPNVVPSLGSKPSTAASVSERSPADMSEVLHLQSIIAEKNTKIAALTAEFDAHRADFRSTLDTLELASTETERVYEKKVEDLLEERRGLIQQSGDVENIAQQLRGMEEVIQELEEGLEDARRGEAEARGEVEFLRGEVERVRAELRRERERNVELVREVDDLRRNRQRTKVVTRNDVGRMNGVVSPEESTASQGPQSPESQQLNAFTPPEPVSDPELSSPNEPVLQATTEKDLPSPPAESPEAPNPTPVPPPAPENDLDKWCALCEQDGHDSISCPCDKT